MQLIQQVRADRKEAFVEYLGAYRLMYDSALQIAYDDAFAELRGQKVKTAKFETTFPQVVSQFARSYYMLQIIGGGPVREAAISANDALWALAYGSFSATEAEFLELDQSASRTRNDVRDAMRSELGVDE